MTLAIKSLDLFERIYDYPYLFSGPSTARLSSYTVHNINTNSTAITAMATFIPHQWAMSMKKPASMHRATRMVKAKDKILFILR